MKQLERIAKMEEILNRARSAADALEEALDRYEEVKKDLEKLESYYTGGKWRKDYEDQEKWRRMMLVNIAKAGFFSSDRTIAEYDRDIWHLK